MHKYVLTRGNKYHTEKWENDLCAQHLPFELKDKDGNIKKMLAELNVRPINLYEIIYPEACEKAVMGILKPISTPNKKINRVTKMLSKALGLEEVKCDWKPFVVPSGTGVSVMVVGNKKDTLNWNPKKDNDVFKQGLKPQENL